MRLSARKPVVGTLCALITAALLAVPAMPTHAAGCPGEAAPPPAIDSSEALTPGALSPTPVPEPATPAGGPTLARCGYLLPPGAPPLPADLGFASWVIQDLDTGAILAAKDPHARERPASLIKLLLAQVVARELNPATVIVGTKDDANQQGTRVGIGPGGQYTVGMLVKALLMASGNDVAYALAVQLGGVPATIAKMNALARQLGAQDTRAATPSGLDGPGMSTSAYDLSIFLRVDMATPMLADAMSTRQMAFPGFGNKPGFMIDNDNLLLRTYPGDIGGKTGYTDDAQQTYADAAVQGGHRIALVMTRGTNHLLGRWQNARELMNYGFALENAHAAPIGRVVTLAAATATTANNGAPVTTSHGNAQLTTVPQTSMSTFGNVGLPLTVLAAIGLLLIGLLYLRREKAKKARAAAAARVASAETVRVALPRDLATRRTSPDDEVTRAFASPPTTRQRPPAPQSARTQAIPGVNGHPVSRPRPAATPRPAQPRPSAPRPSTTPAPEWPTGPEWPT